jgi:PAS domain S-box-containing protein
VRRESARTSSLEEPRDRYLGLYDLAPVGYVTLDIGGTIVEANLAATALLGVDRAELVGCELSSFMTATDADVFRRHREEALRRGTAFGCEIALRRAGAPPVPVHVRSRVLRDGAAEVDGFLCVLFDLSERRALEQELRQAQKMEAVGAFAGAIAHDFGNLLQGIMGCAALAASEQTSPDRRQIFLERILDAVKRGSGLVAQLTAFSRKQEAEPTPVSVDEVIDDLATLIERLVGEQIELEIRTGAPRGLVMGAATQLEQILMNLAANARDAMPEGGRLAIETEEVRGGGGPGELGAGAERSVRLTVRDSGAGMDERTKSRMFEPFFTTKPPGLGTGIGLSTVLAITRGLGGRVEVESEPGRGATFVFHFPCCPEAAPEAAAASGVGPRFRGCVLLIEDHALVRMTVRHYLEDLGLEVLEAGNPMEALAVCESSRTRIDFCVSDVTMPGSSGPRLMCTLAQRYPGLRVLYISAHPTSELVARGILDDAAVTLQKPFGQPELAAKLTLLLES